MGFWKTWTSSYTVAIGQTEVKVDAGNGKVLYTDDAKSENDGMKRPSSIQVAEPVGGDGDGETNDGKDGGKG